MRIEVRFSSKEVFIVDGRAFDSGGFECETDRGDVQEAILLAIRSAKAELENYLPLQTIDTFSMYGNPMGLDSTCTDGIYFLPPSGESSYSVRVDKLITLRDQAVESGLFEVKHTEDLLTITPLSKPSYDVVVYIGGENYEAGVRDWHEHFESIEEVTHFCWWIMTSGYRVVVECCDGKRALSWLEIYGKSGWDRYTPVYFFNPYVREEWLDSRGVWSRTYYQQKVYEANYEGKELLDLDENGDPVGSFFGERVESVTSSVICEMKWNYFDRL